MTEKQKDWGLAWHIFHDRLLGLCFNYAERVDYIKVNKSAEEKPIRLRLFKMVKGELPAELVEAGDAYYRAHQKKEEAYTTLDNAHTRMMTSGSRAEFDSRQKSYGEAGQVDFDARMTLKTAIHTHKAAIEALHAIECPDCPWDGEKIVFAD